METPGALPNQFERGRPMSLHNRPRKVCCDREPFTDAHRDCICRLVNEAADEIERLEQAVAAEREACAKIADNATDDYDAFHTKTEIAMAIRARSTRAE